MNLHRDNMQHDEAFLALLSSQRELLNQIRNEQGLRNKNRQETGSIMNQAPTNRSIAERRSSFDMLLSKRFSFGLGCDQPLLPTFPMDGDRADVDLDDETGFLSELERKRVKVEEHVSDAAMKRKKKRRLSSLGFLTASFFEDHMKPGLREPASPMSDPPADSSKEDGGLTGLEGSDEEEHHAVFVGPLEFDESAVAPKVDMDKVMSAMETFNTAMEQSQKSQQDIHDWDRKMGLKRSHSKTMRQSSRSRKKLRSVLKKEINAMATKV